METASGNDLVDSPSISFKEYGPPTARALKNRAYDVLTRDSYFNIRTPEQPYPESDAFPELKGRIADHIKVYKPIEFQQKDKGEDRIFSGYISGYPTIIVADGVSVIESATGQFIVGKGGEAAQESTLATLKTLAEGLKPGLDPLEIYDMLEQTFTKSATSLKEKDLVGATTLLIGFLYEHRREGKIPKKMWHYAYEGDGNITIVSPGRKIDGWPTRTHLLTPQKLEQTAAVSARGSSVKPVIGSVEYTDDDFLYINSDGMSNLHRWLPKNKRVVDLAIVISEATKGVYGLYGPPDPAIEIASTIRDYPFGDDAVLGIIATKSM